MRATEKASWELANKEKRFGFGKIVGKKRIINNGICLWFYS
jgi:hypothetical protein